MRFKWGVGRLVADAHVTPIVIPIYHQGMDSILPNREPYWYGLHFGSQLFFPEDLTSPLSFDFCAAGI